MTSVKSISVYSSSLKGLHFLTFDTHIFGYSEPLEMKDLPNTNEDKTSICEVCHE